MLLRALAAIGVLGLVAAATGYAYLGPPSTSSPKGSGVEFAYYFWRSDCYWPWAEIPDDGEVTRDGRTLRIRSVDVATRPGKWTGRLCGVRERRLVLFDADGDIQYTTSKTPDLAELFALVDELEEGGRRADPDLLSARAELLDLDRRWGGLQIRADDLELFRALIGPFLDAAGKCRSREARHRLAGFLADAFAVLQNFPESATWTRTRWETRPAWQERSLARQLLHGMVDERRAAMDSEFLAELEDAAGLDESPLRYLD